MKNLYLYLLLLSVLVVTNTYAGGGKITLNQRTNLATSSNTDSYADADIDTVIWNREAGVTAISFGAHWADSVSIDRMIVRRVINGTQVPVAAGDTLTPHGNAASTYTYVGVVDGAPTSTIFAHGKGMVAPVTLAPAADQYLFIIDYAATANGVTTPTVKFEVIKTYSDR